MLVGSFSLCLDFLPHIFTLALISISSSGARVAPPAPHPLTVWSQGLTQFRLVSVCASRRAHVHAYMCTCAHSRTRAAGQVQSRAAGVSSEAVSNE